MALPFGLATAPLEFTKVVDEVKLMAQARGIRIHQYLDDWLLRAPCRETCLDQTRSLMDLCQRLEWVVNLKKSELIPQQEFNFVGYRFDLSRGLVKPTQERWQALTPMIKMLMTKEDCSVRQFMSLIGLLTATEELANLISKLNFYKLIPYPMDNMLNRSAQTVVRSTVHSPDGASYFLPV